MNPVRRVLVVEDDSEMRDLICEELGLAGYLPLPAAGGRAALKVLEAEVVDAIVTDLMMPGMKGGELLNEVQASAPEVPVVIITAFGTVESAVDAMRAGAFHYISKPFRMEQLLGTVENAIQHRRVWPDLRRGNPSGASERVSIIAESAAMRKALELTMRAASAAAPVLLLGESGTGKEVFARALHAAGPRRDEPFLAVNCAAIPETLLESQLFGHRRGSFTDAREDSRGLFVEAGSGTLLLDEIGDLSALVQAKLLRVLQEHEVHPVGAPAPVAVQARIVAATHVDLERAVQEGRFRQDLYYRLNVIQVRIPPLRERMEDLMPLALHFIARHAQGTGRPPARLDAAVVEVLRRHDWPGNVRELENAIERALVLGTGDSIAVGDLPLAVRGKHAARPAEDAAGSLADVEREHILRTLGSVGGNRAAAARMLNVDRKTLYRKLRAYGLA